MADSKKILFWPDVYKEQGHWLPTLAWADHIYTKNNKEDADVEYDIAYMGILDCKEIVEKHIVNGDGYKYTYYPIFQNIYKEGYTNEVQTSPSNRWKPDHIWALAYAGFHEVERKKFKASTKLIEDAEQIHYLFEKKENFDFFKPNLIVSGFFTSLETLILYHHGIDHSKDGDGKIHTRSPFENVKFAISTTYLRHPEEDPVSRAKQNLMAFSDAERSRLMKIVYHHKYKEEDIQKAPEVSIDDFVAPLYDFPEFIPCPKSFDYSHYVHRSTVQYGEPCIGSVKGFSQK